MKRAFALLVLPFALSACPKDQELTAAQAQESLQQASDSSQADNLAAASIDISTNFTIGGAAAQAANDLKAFIASQLPCAEVSLSGATLSVKYGVNTGNCTYDGHTFSGMSRITVSRNTAEDVEVDHTFTALSNGVVRLDGTAHVTWSGASLTRHVVHDFKWTHLASLRTGEGTGDRTQTPLPGGVSEGFRVDGTRSWTGASGTWDLSIDGVEMRWADPVPQAGTYSLSTPYDKSISMAFSRVDADTIAVEVTGPKHSFGFDVAKTGDFSSN